MTKHEEDVIGGLNMTDQISNETYKQIMIAAQDENEVGDVLDMIRAEIEEVIDSYVCDVEENTPKAQGMINAKIMALNIIDKYRKDGET